LSSEEGDGEGWGRRGKIGKTKNRKGKKKEKRRVEQGSRNSLDLSLATTLESIFCHHPT
jgi:hypothetical protein